MSRRSSDERRKSERRIKPRFVNPPLECDHGRVIDLSADGLCLELTRRRRFQPGDELTLKLGELNDVPTRVAWVKRGFGKRVIGVAFDEVTPELRQMLSSVAVRAVSMSTLNSSADSRRAA